MAEEDTRADRVIQRLKNNRYMAAAIAVGIIVIAVSTFTDAAKNLYGLIAKPGPEEAREQLARISLQFTPQQFIGRAKAGDEAAVKLFLSAGMSPDVTQEDEDDGGVERNRTAMMYAAGGDYVGIVEALLKAGADVNKTANEETALSWAAAWGSMKTIPVLLEHGASPESIEGALAVAGPSGREDVVRALLPYVKDVKRTATSVLLDTIDSTTVDANEAQIKDIAALMLEQGADVNGRNDDGWTPLQLAALHGRGPIVPLLLDKGADIDAKCVCTGWSGGGWDALMLAIKEPYDNIVQALIGRDAKVNQANNDGETPLMLAAEAGDAEVVKSLLAHGASADAKNAEGHTALQLTRRLPATGAGSVIVPLLEKAGAK